MALRVVWRPMGGLRDDIEVEVISIRSEDGRAVVRAADISGGTFAVNQTSLWILGEVNE